MLVTYAGYPFSPTNFLPDNGLAILAGVLKEAGYEVKILDYNTPSIIRRLYPEKISTLLEPIIKKILKNEGKLTLKEKILLSCCEKRLEYYQEKVPYEIGKEICEIIEKEKIDFVGLKLWNGDGFTGSLAIANVIKKKFPHFPIFAGGPHVDIFREYIFKATRDFDALVYGEGEESIVMLAEYVEGKRKLEEIPNLIYKKNGKITVTPIKRVENLDELPFPLYDEEVYPSMKADNEKIKMIVIDDSRGCNHKCHFCIHPVKSGRLRIKSPERMVRELEEMRRKYGIKIFRYAGSSTPTKILGKIARLIIQRGLDIEYTTFGHVKGANLEDFKALKESGCYAVFFGVESGSQRILSEIMNKGVKVEEIKKALSLAKKAGLFVAGSLIYPSPTENEETKKETLKLLRETRPNSAPVQFPLICPQTEWAKNPSKYGFDVNERVFMDVAMRYKIKFLFPPRFWKPFPYRISGKPFSTYVRESEEFIREVESLGILTTISDEMALLAKCAGLSVRDFREKYRLYSLIGDHEKIRSEFVQKINHYSVSS